MAKITIKKEEVSRLKENPEVLQELFIYAIEAEDIKAIELLCELTPIKSHIDKQKLFNALICVVGDDKKYELVKSIIEQLEVDLSQQTDEEDTEAALAPQAAQKPQTSQKITLLRVAACYGSVKIGEFLLDQGFDPNHKDAYQRTPLHYAAMHNQEAFITLLHNHGANLNIKDDKGYTALHWTVLYKRYAIREQLKKLGANPNIKDNHGYNYQELHKHIIKTNQEKSPPILPPIAPPEHFNLYKGIVSFCKAILSDKEREKNIIDTIDSIKKFLNPLAKPTTNVASVQELPVSSVYIEKALRTLASVYQCYKDDNNSTALQKYIIEKAKYWESSTALAMLYNIIAVEYLNIADYNNAKEHLELANEAWNEITIQDKFVQELQYNIFFNLGKAWKYFSVNESIKYFTLAQTLMPNNQNTVLELLKHYIGCQNDEESLTQLNKIADQDLKELYSIIRQLHSRTDFNIATELKLQAGNTKDKELRKLYTIMSEFESQSGSTISKLCTTYGFTFPEHGDSKASKYTLYIEIWAKHFLQQKAFTKAIDCWLELNNHRTQHNIPIHLFNILDICKNAEYWEKGLEYIKDIYTLYPDLSNHTMLPLKYLEFIFYEANDCQQQSKNCWDFLKDHALKDHDDLFDITSRLFSYAKDFALYTAIGKGDFNKALSYLSLPVALDEEILQAGLQSFPRHLEQLLYEKIFNEKLLLLLKKLQCKISSSTTVAIERTTLTLDLDLTKDLGELEKLIEGLNHEIIHEYFQHKKMELLQRSIEPTFKKPSYVWNTPTGEVYSSNDKDVYPVKGTENCYVTINPKLFAKLTPELQDQFSDALLKGLISKDHKSNGLKIIHKRLMELKILGDDRLYTKHIYKTPDKDKYLIEFNYRGKHRDIKNQMEGKSSWEVIICEDKVSCTPNIPEEAKKTDTPYSFEHHITQEMGDISVSKEEWAVNLFGNDDVE